MVRSECLLVFQGFQYKRGARRLHRLYSFDLIPDNKPELFSTGNAQAHYIAVFAGDSMQFFNFGNPRELRRDLPSAKFGLYKNKSYERISHYLLEVTQVPLARRNGPALAVSSFSQDAPSSEYRGALLPLQSPAELPL